MPLTFKYTAKNPKTGETVKSTVEADNEQAAAKLIKARGLAPTDIMLLSNNTSSFGKFFKKVKAKDKILFSRQLSTLINAGLPLVQSLRSVANQTTNKEMKLVITQVISDVEAGASFSNSLSKHPDVFNEIFISLVAAGEASGTLDAALERIANQQEKDAEILSKVRGAMVYPAVVIFVMVAVVGFMVVKVLPQVEGLYKGIQGAQLPLITRIMLGVSHLVTRFWWVILILIIAGGFFTSRWARTLGGKQVIDRIKMRAWPFGDLFMKVYMARFARTAQTLVASGVPLLQVLDITARSINNVHVADALHKASEKVKGGKALSDAITNDPNFLELVPNMLRIGEQSGSLENMLSKVADYYEKEVDTQIKTISTIIEPVLMILLGVVAFAVVAAVLLPIYGLAGRSLV